MVLPSSGAASAPGAGALGAAPPVRSVSELRFPGFRIRAKILSLKRTKAMAPIAISKTIPTKSMDPRSVSELLFSLSAAIFFSLARFSAFILAAAAALAFSSSSCFCSLAASTSKLTSFGFSASSAAKRSASFLALTAASALAAASSSSFFRRMRSCSALAFSSSILRFSSALFLALINASWRVFA